MSQEVHNEDWAIEVNLSGISAASGKKTHLPGGFYTMKVERMYTRDQNPKRVVIRLSVVGGEYAGVVRHTGINKPTSADDNVLYYWRALAESAGYSPAQLDAGSVRLTAAAFVGRETKVKYTAKEDTPTKQHDDVVFLSPPVWEEQRGTAKAAPKENMDVLPSSSEALGSANNLAAAPAKADVLQSLGLA